MLINKYYQKIKQRLLLKSRFIYLWWLYKKSKAIASNQKSAIVFAPHQDDETLGCGGAIALKCEQGVPLDVVFLTDGRASYADYPQICPDQLVQTRQQEAIAALKTLGVLPSAIHFLGKPDGGLLQLSARERQQTIDQLVQLLRDRQPQEVYIPYKQDIHPDHKETYALVQAAVQKTNLSIEVLQYPVWTRWVPHQLDFKSVELANVYRLPINNVINKKIKALEAYQSQYSSVVPGIEPILPSGFMQCFFSPYEIFFKAS
ncbi:PIG-L deacetylase family protein [Gloeocapsopsis sp. IPPAS B-1203]|uniref:PIG-L deacetylase family protein n=1 Tax=Gloeocapsopsis sp. IPPAS B-1203 TaxID=2049454 RepID=UPI000C1A21FD|nr:PIG-L deacetylase family protein [Gloeocapsopsis sp. IPPAS B-1203]PIG93353.1 GlcNAc-PI de-N-acetylase [Gloeocapsopsis sp. IPPAS B-1203]